MYALSICMSEIIVYCLQPSTQLFSVSMLKHTDSPSYFMPQYVKSKRSKWLQQKYCEVQACVCAQGTLSILQLQATQKQPPHFIRFHTIHFVMKSVRSTILLLAPIGTTRARKQSLPRVVLIYNWFNMCYSSLFINSIFKNILGDPFCCFFTVGYYEWHAHSFIHPSNIYIVGNEYCA